LRPSSKSALAIGNENNSLPPNLIINIALIALSFKNQVIISISFIEIEKKV